MTRRGGTEMNASATDDALPSARLARLGLVLPQAATPSFAYVPVVVEGTLVFVSGQLPKVDGEVRMHGRLGDTITLEQGREAARICALQALSCLAEALGSLDRVRRIVRLSGFVSSTADFFQHPVVIDAASDLMVQVFGEAGRHARSAIGVSALPRNSPVELEVIASIHPDA
jgi:enamine deaminase RidA (YjgF/YER057c/UK114 family)